MVGVESVWEILSPTQLTKYIIFYILEILLTIMASYLFKIYKNVYCILDASISYFVSKIKINCLALASTYYLVLKGKKNIKCILYTKG